MNRIQRIFAATFVTGLFTVAAPALANDQAQPSPQTQDQPLQGKVRMTEIGLGEAPQAARTAIEQWAQGAEIKKVHEVRQGTRIQYQAEIEREGRNQKVLVNDRGQVLKSGTGDLGLDREIF